VTDLNNKRKITKIQFSQNPISGNKRLINAFNKDFTISAKELKPPQHLKSLQRPYTHKQILPRSHDDLLAVLRLNDLLDWLDMGFKGMDEHIFMLESLGQWKTPHSYLST